MADKEPRQPTHRAYFPLDGKIVPDSGIRPARGWRTSPFRSSPARPAELRPERAPTWNWKRAHRGSQESSSSRYSEDLRDEGRSPRLAKPVTRSPDLRRSLTNPRWFALAAPSQ